MTYVADTAGGGFVGNHLTVAALEALRPAAYHVGRIATVGTPGQTGTYYISCGSGWVPILPGAVDSAGNVTGLVGVGGTVIPTPINIIQIGSGAYACDRTGATDCSAAFAAAIAAAAASAYVGSSGLSDARTKAIIDIPPGQYLITTAGAMMGNEAHASKTVGLRFRGAGRGATQIIFQPASAGALCTNVKWLDIQFDEIEFISKTAGCTLFYVNPGTSNEQEYTFHKCDFYSWKYVLYLTGSNNNSENSFTRCGNYSMEQAGAWLYIPNAGAADQFLNHWFKDCRHWSTSAPVIDIAYGGHVSIQNLDASAWGGSAVAAPATPDLGTYLFKLRGNSHGYGVVRFFASEIRGEFQNAHARLLYSEWGGAGGVTFKGVDLSSASGTYTYDAAMVYILLPNTFGAAYLFEDCPYMAGGVTVEYGVNAWSYDHRIKIRECSWMQKSSPSDVITYVPTAAHGNLNVPIVEFEGCRSLVVNYYNFTAATAFPVWDASIGAVAVSGVNYTPTRLQSKKRTIILNNVYGALDGTTVGYAKLPLGAIITDCRASCYAGGGTSAVGGTWTIESDKAGTPTTVATLTTAVNLSTTGFNVGGPLATQYKCTTAAKCIISVTPSGIASTAGVNVLVEISGYW